jgi:hypothetical protein
LSRRAIDWLAASNHGGFRNMRELRTAFGGARPFGIGREGGVHSPELRTELANLCIEL